MKLLAIFLGLGLTLTASLRSPQDSASSDVSEILRQMYEDDQAVRAEDWSVFTPEQFAELHRADGERRSEVLAIVADDALRTGDDHYYAAMILQHGGRPEDYLLSHVLATVAGFEGHKTAKWLAAASLDRYLQSVERPQIFGTQYLQAGGETTQDPIDAQLLPDSVRRRYGVPSAAESAQQLESMR